MNFREEFLIKEPNINIHYLERYIKLVDLIKKGDHENEDHHILPKSIWPVHLKNDENIITIPAKWHYIFHWILFKMFQKSETDYKYSVIFAFNQMKRVIKSKTKKGTLYAMSRKYVKEDVSISNTGRKRTEEQLKIMSVQRQGMVIVKYAENHKGKNFKVKTDDPRYLTGELVFYRTGTKHTKETMAKFKENSGTKGKIPCCNAENVVKYFHPDNIPDGFKPGISPLMHDILSKGKKKLFFYNDGVKNIRIKEGKEVPEGFVRGKLKKEGFVGWDAVNERRKKEREEKNE